MCASVNAYTSSSGIAKQESEGFTIYELRFTNCKECALAREATVGNAYCPYSRKVISLAAILFKQSRHLGMAPRERQRAKFPKS